MFAQTRATKPAKHCLAIITTEILEMLCFARAIESFLVHADLPEEQKRQLLATKTAAIGTILVAEEHARALDKSYPDTCGYFKLGDFVSKDSFFVRVRQFWNLNDLW